MLDIKFIRDNADIVKEAIRKKHIRLNLDELLDADIKRRALLVEVEDKRAKQNEYTEKISKEVGSKRDEMIQEMRSLKTSLQKEEEELGAIMKHWRGLMLEVPNIPDMSVPEGENDESNEEIKTWGEQTQFSFTPKSHVELMTELDMIEFQH